MTTRATTQSGQGLLAHLAMTALTLTLIGAFVLWQVRDGAGETAAPVASTTTTSSLRTDATDTRDGAEAALARPTRTSGLVIYIVASDEAAAALRSELDQARQHLGGFGLPLAVLVLVAGSSEAENLAGLPLPPGTRIFDTRDTTAPDRAALASVCGLQFRAIEC